ncbi:hypothetical protein I3679_000550 [Proteus mirabilis]|uniref:Uncharacterized protein n=1 Tax=Proteus mirabilis TaxID=584 RepID=A0ABD5LV04_PROMI
MQRVQQALSDGYLTHASTSSSNRISNRNKSSRQKQYCPSLAGFDEGELSPHLVFQHKNKSPTTQRLTRTTPVLPTILLVEISIALDTV